MQQRIGMYLAGIRKYFYFSKARRLFSSNELSLHATLSFVGKFTTCAARQSTLLFDFMRDDEGSYI